MTLVLTSGTRELLYLRLLAMYRRSFGRVAASEEHVEQMTRDSLDEARSLEQLRGLVAATGVPLEGKQLLEVGSGIGLTVASARRKMGAEAFGIEPGDDEYEGTLKMSWEILATASIDPAVIQHGVGEAIPFPDNHFDVVYSSNVLEHVNVPPKVIAEIVRVPQDRRSCPNCRAELRLLVGGSLRHRLATPSSGDARQVLRASAQPRPAIHRHPTTRHPPQA